MQTWAKRGVQTGSMAGGMPATGHGAASATANCSDRSISEGTAPEPGALDRAAPGRSGHCFAGELLPDENRSLPSRGFGKPAQQTVTALSGTIDPLRDLLPAIEDARTRELPHITNQPKHAARSERSDRNVSRRAGPTLRTEPAHEAGRTYGTGQTGPVSTAEQVWIPPESVDDSLSTTRPFARIGHPLTLAGWITDSPQSGDARAGELTPASGHPCAALGILPHNDTRGRHAREAVSGTPSEGFHRSLSWSGSIGNVVTNGRGTSSGATVGSPASTGTSAALVVPSGDPTVVEGIRQPGSIVALWEDTLGRMKLPGRLSSPAVVPARDVELTSGRLGGGAELLTVPHSLLSAALSSTPDTREPAEQNSDSLEIPGLWQEQATEVPNLSGLVPFEALPSPGAAAHGGAELPEVEVSPASVFGELDIPGESETTAPITAITRALEGHWFREEPVGFSEEPMSPAFSTDPQLTDVRVTVLDELVAAMPERMQVVRNPFGPSPATRTAPAGGMALPVLTGGVPDIAVMQDETRPLPRLRSDGAPVLTAVAP
ncbi:hypothetical protein DFQ14_101541 [Halopolyspora algeriensis]|uniref:Uncharacterized protein n=1 Tax=Halopolyspora algeriensis TaxID=1500506 RepID=A0A368VZ63_9ACTN|nr:hypothetical protein [Halopolyspora algeriensis]RCW47195.1 hypothetical protein DFQ14_101541 [Halopolyspora algeriensis]TQM48281.1 hypothetical protein FHU43_3247 [Halopolyspora algeriensis]